MDDDSRAPMTPVEAARRLWLIDQRIQAKTDDLIALRKGYAELVKQRRLAYAKAFLSAEGILDVRKQRAEIESADAKFAVDAADQEIEAAKDKLRELRDSSEIGRAINSNLKEELRTLGDRP